MVMYESPYRVVRTLRDLEATLGNRQIVVVRELTKKFEEVVRGSLTEINSDIEQLKLKGEFVLVIEGAGKQKGS